MKVIIPATPENLGGPFIVAPADSYELCAEGPTALILRFHELPEGVSWFEAFAFMYAQRQHDPQSVKVMRQATNEEVKLFRVPVWIQGEEVPECCGHPMVFVGQLDDDRIRTERPPGAKLWWHDGASFYVFTCSQCLECKAVGQQF